MMVANYNWNHFTIYVSQIIVLYSLNLYNNACQLFLNKTQKKLLLKVFVLSLPSKTLFPQIISQPFQIFIQTQPSYWAFPEFPIYHLKPYYTP